MAHKSLPGHKEALNTIAVECEIQWKAEVDSEMAYTIITGSASGRDGSTDGEDTFPDMENIGEDVFARNTDEDLIARDANETLAAGDIKDIVVRHTAVGVDNPGVDPDNIIKDLMKRRAKEDRNTKGDLVIGNAGSDIITDKTGKD